ncbi:MAG: TonB-dependent receptor [Gammaproteobacteria bacterium]|nr:TonB-dependent receptor [Gammaproteobacteria bacterium]MBU1480685.1 TonB-dependent receptor [Gammaproteobacteria bacterium]
MNLKLKASAVAVALTFAPGAFAEETATVQEAATMPEVVVKANKLQPLPDVGTVKEQGIASKRASTSDTASMLDGQPGVSLYGAGGVSSLPVIHGLADDRIRTKLDGMDLIASCPNHMNPPLSYVDPSNVDLIKVYAGIAPVSVGGDSIGGTIVVETQAPEFAAAGQGSIAKGEVGAFYRSNNKAKGANVAATFATEKFNVSYSGATSKADNYKAGGDFKNYDFTGRIGHTLPYDEVGSTAYLTRNHTLGFAFKRDNQLFEAKFGLQDMPYQLYPNQRMDMLNNDQKSLNLRYLGQQDWGSLEARAYHETVDHFMDFGADKRYWYGNGAPPTGSGGSTALNGFPCSPISATCAAGMPMYTQGKTTGASVKADVSLNEQDLLRVGGELQQYTLNDWWTASGAMMQPYTFWNINNGKRDRSALFGEWEKRSSPQWMSLVGVRFERVSMNADVVHGYNQDTFPTVVATGANNQIRDAANFNNADRSKTDNNLDLTALARYTADESQDIEFGFAHKVRSPNVYERYTWSTWQMAALMNNFVGDGNGYLGDVNLKPEKANTLSVTLDWHAADSSWGFKATPYYTRVSDYIDAVQWNGTTDLPATTLATNAFSVLKYANQSARLYGIDLSGHMALAESGWGAWGMTGLINYTRGKNLDTGDDLYNIMPLNSKLALTQKVGGWDNRAELVMVQAKKNVSDMRNEIKTPGYSLVHLRGSYSWKQVRVDFGVENLFDKFYYLPTGGAYTGQGTTMTNPALPNYPQWGTAVPGMGRSLYTGLNYKF